MTTEQWALLVAVLALLGIDGARGWKILKWIARRGKPAPAPAPIPVEIVPTAATSSNYPPIKAPGTRNVVGRDEDFKKLRTTLASGKGAQITSAGAVLQGEGGRGKSTLARYYAERLGHTYDGGCWVPAQTREAVFDALASFGQLAFDMPAPEPIGAPHIHAVLQRIAESDARLLFVFDNVHGTEMAGAEHSSFTYTDLRPFMPAGDRIDVILTTRAGSGFDGFTTIPLEVLPFGRLDSPAVDLLLQEAGVQDADLASRALAKGLAARLGGLPLALTIGGALVREGARFEDMTDRVDEIVTTSLPNSDYPDSVAAAVTLSLAGLGTDARALLDICA